MRLCAYVYVCMHACVCEVISLIKLTHVTVIKHVVPDCSPASTAAEGVHLLWQHGYLQLAVEVAGTEVLLWGNYLQLAVEVVVGAEALLWGEYLALGTVARHGYLQLAVEVVGTEALQLDNFLHMALEVGEVEAVLWGNYLQSAAAAL